MKSERGRTRWVWEKIIGHERNEALDCRNYALAAFRILDPDMDAVERRLKGLGNKGQDQQQTAPQKRRGVVKNSAVGGDDW